MSYYWCFQVQIKFAKKSLGAKWLQHWHHAMFPSTSLAILWRNIGLARHVSRKPNNNYRVLLLVKIPSQQPRPFCHIIARPTSSRKQSLAWALQSRYHSYSNPQCFLIRFPSIPLICKNSELIYTTMNPIVPRMITVSCRFRRLLGECLTTKSCHLSVKPTKRLKVHYTIPVPFNPAVISIFRFFKGHKLMDTN